jgi:phosphatidyl-myo-inositol alpha-mannosyltransferase
MKIALISPYALNIFGGVQEQTLAMSRELSRRGHEVLVVAPNSADRGTYDTPAEVLFFGPLLSLPANGSKAPLTLSPRAARHARRAVKTFSPDVVHFHEPFAPLVGWSVLRSHEYPAVATFHRSGDGPAVRLTRPLLRMLARGVDVSAAVSQMAKETMGKASGLSPNILFNGFEVERFTSVPREVPTESRLVTVGRLEERKGVHVVLDAVLRHNAESSVKWYLDIIGDGPERSRLEGRAKGDNAVRFHGALSEPEKMKILRKSSVFVAPALFGESFGMVLLEAMASEVPVVASDIDGYRQACDGNATLFPAGDVSALMRVLETALVSSSDQEVARARAHAATWSMSSLMDSYETLYAKAVEDFSSTN